MKLEKIMEIHISPPWMARHTRSMDGVNTKYFSNSWILKVGVVLNKLLVPTRGEAPARSASMMNNVVTQCC